MGQLPHGGAVYAVPIQTGAPKRGKCDRLCRAQNDVGPWNCGADPKWQFNEGVCPVGGAEVKERPTAVVYGQVL